MPFKTEIERDSQGGSGPSLEKTVPRRQAAQRHEGATGPVQSCLPFPVLSHHVGILVPLPAPPGSYQPCLIAVKPGLPILGELWPPPHPNPAVLVGQKAVPGSPLGVRDKVRTGVAQSSSVRETPALQSQEVAPPVTQASAGA